MPLCKGAGFLKGHAIIGCYVCERLYALSYALRACMAILWIARAVYTESLKPELGVHRLMCVSLGVHCVAARIYTSSSMHSSVPLESERPP